MEAFPEPDTFTVLPDAVHQQLWDRINARLQRGDSLITTRDYVAAVTSEYEAITGEAVSADLRKLFQSAIHNYNREYPERYVAHGVRNSVVRAFQSGCFKLNWDVLQIQSVGARSVARFKSQNWVRGFLKEVRVAPSSIRPDDCVDNAVKVLSGLGQPLVAHDPSVPVTPAADAPDADPDEPPAPDPEPLSEDAAEALSDGTVSQGEVQNRQQEQEEARSRIEAREIGRAAERVDSYVQQGYLTTDEGAAVRQLSDIDRRVEAGEIDNEEASRLRNSLLTKEQRYALERKVKGAVDHAVRFLQAFESMQRIDTELDEGLRFLIFHKNILDSNQSAVERGRAAQELLEDRDMLHKIIDIMDRKDQEVRMISVGLPPYSYVVKRNERIGNLTIEEEFIDDLRSLSADDMSEILHSEDAQTRVRPAADVRCLIAIVSHLIKPTPWRKDVRLLRVQDTIEQFYHDTDDIGEARKQAESFLNRRLRRMFKDLTGDEKEEMEQRGAEMIDAIEQKVVAERESTAAEEAGQTRVSTEDPVAAHDDDNLTEEEQRMGATIGRVEMRIAGNMRRVPRKIMRSPDDPDQFVLAQRNPDTQELEPVLRRGAPRLIERGTDGFWKVTSN